MPRFEIDTVVTLSERAWTEKDRWMDLLQECYEYALPDRNPYYYNGTGKPEGRSGTKGRDKTSRRVFDSTLQHDAQKISNRIQFELFPIGHQWANFTPGAFVDSQVEEQARGELANLQRIVFTAIQFSNFDLAIAEWLLELVIAGTACMMVTEGNRDTPIVYQTVSQSHVALREGALGKIDLISRQHKMRYSLIEQTWQDADLKDLTEEELKDDADADLIDVCYYSAKDEVWYYDVILRYSPHSTNQKKDKRIVQREYDACPWIIARWNKGAEEAHGRSLVMQALPDARVLSAVKNFLLKHAALAVSGVYLVRNDGVVNPNNVRIFPGATIPVRTTGGPAGASVQPLQHGSDVNLAQLVIGDLVNSINKIMMNDGLPDISEGVRTATELIERMKELQQNLGAPFARILKEGIVPMLETTIDILSRLGVIPVAEGRRIRLNNGEIEVKFASSLVQGQAIREVETARNAMAITAEAAGPQAVQLNFKIEDFGSWVAGKLGVVPDIVRNKAEREQVQQLAGQAAAISGGQIPSVGGPGGVTPANQQQAPIPTAA